MIIVGIVKKSKQLASGMGTDPSLPVTGTIALQKPFLMAAGAPHLDEMYNGTINMDIGPSEFHIHKPDYTTTCEWYPGITETIWLVRGTVIYNGIRQRGFQYFPLPSPLKYQKNNIIELITYKFDGLQYGDEVSFELPSALSSVDYEIVAGHK